MKNPFDEGKRAEGRARKDVHGSLAAREFVNTTPGLRRDFKDRAGQAYVLEPHQTSACGTFRRQQPLKWTKKERRTLQLEADRLGITFNELISKMIAQLRGEHANGAS